MKTSTLFSIVKNLFFCLLIAAVFQPLLGHAASVAAAALFASGFVPVKLNLGTAFRNEVVTTIFSRDLQKNLYPDNSFYKGCKVDEGVAIDAESVDVPQAGGRPKVIKNPEQLPIPARIRKDDKKLYSVDLYATEPDIVTDVNQAIVSYDKMGAILEDHRMELQTRIADELGYIWLPTLGTNFIRTTGAATGSIVAGMTSTRKALTYQDIIDLASLMDRMEIPDDGNRRILIYTDQQAEIKKIPEFRDFDKTGIVGQFANGSIGKIQNMNVYKRSRPLLYDNSGNPVKKAYGSTVLPTDNLAALAWHPSFVRYAEGIVQVYYEAKKVGYQGDMMNAAVRGGGMISRKDERGVVALIQSQ